MCSVALGNASDDRCLALYRTALTTAETSTFDLARDGRE